jgi:hypothetical protein
LLEEANLKAKTKDDIKVDFEGVETEGIYWTLLVQDSEQERALLDRVANFWVP